MQILQLIFSFFFYMKFNVILASSNQCEVSSIAYGSPNCDGPAKNRFTCWIDLMYRILYSECRNHSYDSISVGTTNLLLLYPPFIDTFLNYSKEMKKMHFIVYLQTNETVFDIDLRILNEIQSSLNFQLHTLFRSDSTEIIIRMYSSYKRAFSQTYTEYERGLYSEWQITHNKNQSMKNDDIICFHLKLKGLNYPYEDYYALSYDCPSDRCSTSQNNTRICLGTTPCLNMGDRILLCRIDQLRFNDQFNSKISLSYTEIVLTTSDTEKQTLHKLSTYLFHSCIALRFIIVVLHGRLEIPSLNFTSFDCPYGLTIEIEFWHGHCSTFEILYSNDLERMYETNLITFGNFYTSEVDRLNITCINDQSTGFIRQNLRLSDIIIVCLLGMMIFVMCIVGCYYGRGWNYYR